jgi:predicted membrane protein
LIIGVLLLLAAQGLFEFEILWEILLPVIVVLIGLFLIFGNKVDFNVKEKTKCLDSKDTENIFVAFGEQNVNKAGENFEKANLNAIFGSVKLDLREAKLEKETVIGAWAIFGGIEILVPKDCIVKVKGTPIFGGISNERKNKEDAKKTIYIEGYAVFGGIEIK